MEKYGAPGFPTLIAIGADGQELDRQVGFGGLTALVGWMQEMPARALPLDELLGKTKKEPKNGILLVAAAKRLASAGRRAESRAYYTKAAADPKTGAVAAWELGRSDLVSGQESARRKLAETMVTKYPTSEQAGVALQYLATIPKPPLALIDKTVDRRFPAFKDSAGEMNGLVYVLLRAGALRSAGKVAARLEELSKDNPAQLDTVAEYHHMNGERDKAVAVEGRAIGLAKGGLLAGLKENLDRFKRGNQEPAADMLAVRAPTLEPQVASSEKRPRTPPAVKAQNAAMKRIPDECAAVAGNTDRVQAYLFTADKPAAPRVLLRPGTPKALGDCVTKLLTSLEVTGGLVVRVDVALEAPGVKDALKAAVDKAQNDCRATAEAAKLDAVDGALSVDAAGKPVVTLASGGKDLASCVQKAYASVKLPASALRPLSLSFARKVASDTPPPSPFPGATIMALPATAAH